MPIITSVSDPYASTEDYRLAKKKTDGGSDDEILRQLRAVSRWVDRKCHRFFTKDVTPVARTYYPRVAPAFQRPLDWAESENPWLWGGYVRWLLTDDMAELPTTVKVDQQSDGTFTGSGAALANPNPDGSGGDYSLWPENAQLGPEPKPWTALFAPAWSTQGGFPSGKRVQIVCRWGWPAIPDAIRQFTIEVTAIWRLESPRATSRVNEMDQVIGTSRVAQGLVEELLAEYVKATDLI